MARGRAFQNLTQAPDPPPDDHIYRLTVHEGAFGQVPLSDPPAAGIRIIASNFSECSSKGTRARQTVQAGQWPIISLKTFQASESTGPAVSYLTNAVQPFIAAYETSGVTTAPSGGAVEVGNEPYDAASQDQCLRCIAACSGYLRLHGWRVIVPAFIQNTSWTRAMDRLDNPVAATGYCNWGMVDGWSVHSYQDNVQGSMDTLIGIREDLDGGGHTDQLLYFTENGFPVDRLAQMHAASANPGTGWPDAGYTAQEARDKLSTMWNYLKVGGTGYRSYSMRNLKLRNWDIFDWMDINPNGNTNGYGHTGLVEADYEPALGLGIAYDGRAKGTSSPFVPGVGPYGSSTTTPLAFVRSIPETVDLS